MSEPEPEPETVPPCGWQVAPCCPEMQPESQVEDAVQAQALQVATEIIWALSGRRFGACQVTVRPCRTDCARPSTGGFPWTPVQIGGAWHNIGCGICGDMCSCGRVCELVLPGPVASIVEVLIDGEILDTDTYVLFDRRRLVRIDGGCWPVCNDLSLPDGEPGTWSVTYLHGETVPAGGLAAAGALACELVKACAGQECRLSPRVTSLARQGIDIVLSDPSGAFPQGLTGLPEADLWISAVNPYKLAQPARFFSPDSPRPRLPST